MRTKNILKRIGLGFLSLVVLTIIGLLVLILSFDPKSLPENYGETNSVLLVGDQAGQPLLVLLYGGAGCNPLGWPGGRERGQLFIGQGYAVLGIEYFQGLCTDSGSTTPSNLDRIAIEGIYAAINDAAQHPLINEECILVEGNSAGSVVALTLASRYPEVKAVVGVVPANIVYGALRPRASMLMHNGEPVPFAPYPLLAGLKALFTGDSLSLFNAILDNEDGTERGAIPVEQVNGPILLVSGTQDQTWPSTRMSEMMMERLRRNDFPYPFEHVPLEGGHVMGQDLGADEVNRIIFEFLDEYFWPGVASGCPR